VALPFQTEAGLCELVFKSAYNNLAEYLAGFSFTCAVLKDEYALERASMELWEDAWEDGCYYIEVRFAPVMHLGGGLGLEKIISAVDKGLRRGRDTINASLRQADENARPPKMPQPPFFNYGLIICTMRSAPASFSLELACLAAKLRAETDIPIVAFDLAGNEAVHPAREHSNAFAFIKENSIHRTVHAGEAVGPESIWEAIEFLDAERIGHGLHLFDDAPYQAEAFNLIAVRRIPIEVCLTSNLQTCPAIGGFQNHPFKMMRAHGLTVTLCTDNRLISNTTLSSEFTRATEAFRLSPAEIKDLALAGFRHSFSPVYRGLTRDALLAVVSQYYDTVAGIGETRY
jgi:adenosine deaminase